MSQSGIRWYAMVMVWAVGVAAYGQGHVDFSHPGGRYAETFELTLTANPLPDASWSIHYTTNGNSPTASDPQYTAPLPLTEALYSRSEIAHICNSATEFVAPTLPVEKIIVLRAALFDEGGMRRSAVATESYFIRSLFGRDIALPLVSLAVDSLALFDFDTGIFVPGVHLDSNNTNYTGNYWQRGEAWERTAVFHFFDTNHQTYSAPCGLRTHGQGSRKLPQKGLSLFARQEYGSSHLDYPFFPSQDMLHYKRLQFHPFTAPWSRSGLEDYVALQLAGQLSVDRLHSRPVVLFLNGEYWGIYFMQEKADQHYIAAHHGGDKDNYIIHNQWDETPEHGDGQELSSVIEFVRRSDFSDTMRYSLLSKRIDIDNFIDYWTFEMWANNYDWPANNMRMYKSPGEPWRWLLFDLDAALRDHDYNAFQHIMCDDSLTTWPTSANATLFFRALLNSPVFRKKLSNRMDTLCTVLFTYERTLPVLLRAIGEVESEVPYQIQRFQKPKSVDVWRQHIDNIKAILQERDTAYLQRFHDFMDSIPLTAYVQRHPPQIIIYPNPAQKVLTIEYMPQNESLSVEIYQLDGQKKMEETLYAPMQTGVLYIPVDDWTNGMYIARIGNAVRKFIVRK